MCRTADEVFSVGQHIFGLTGPVVGEADYFIPDSEVADAGPQFLDDTREIAALAGGEGSRPTLGHQTLADGGFAGVDAGGLYFYKRFALSRSGQGQFFDMKHIKAAIFVEFDSFEFFIFFHIRIIYKTRKFLYGAYLPQ